MYIAKTPGAINLRGGQTGGAAPDLETLRQFGSSAYYDRCLARWKSTPVPEQAILPDPAFLSRWAMVDQRPRNVCVGFAVAAAVEALRYWNAPGPIEKVSAQFIYWTMRHDFALPDDDQPPGYAIGATRLSQARQVLETIGVVPDSLAPYHLGLVDRSTAPEGTPPSDEALVAADSTEFAEGAYGFHPVGRRPDHSLTQTFHDLLQQGRPVGRRFPDVPHPVGPVQLAHRRRPVRGRGSGPVRDRQQHPA